MLFVIMLLASCLLETFESWGASFGFAKNASKARGPSRVSLAAAAEGLQSVAYCCPLAVDFGLGAARTWPPIVCL